MILDPDQLVQGYPFLARRHNRIPICDPAAVRECCLKAASLAGPEARDEPAAIFFAFADRRRAFPFAWRLMSGYVALAQARINGFSLVVTGEELDRMCREILYGRLTWPEVQRWFSSRLRPLHAP